VASPEHYSRLLRDLASVVLAVLVIDWAQVEALADSTYTSTTVTTTTSTTRSSSYGATIGSAGLIFEGLGNILGAMSNNVTCPALATYNAAAHQVDEEWHSRWAQTFGSVDFKGIIPRDCQKIIPISQFRISQMNYLIPLRQAAEAQCSPITWSGGENSPTGYLAASQHDLAACQQSLATNPGGIAPANPVPVAGNPYANQSASCSTITGPGMTGGPTNCPPNQPYRVTTVTPPQQTQTAAMPPPAPATPSDPATATAQQIFGMLSLPVPQLQPSPAADPEAAARAAFDKGQAAYNAHDCMTALQDFSQAVSLTVSYGTTYSGWRDRAQACAGQVAAVPAPAAPSSTCAPGHDADIQSGNTLQQTAAAQEALGTCTSLNDAAVAYRNAATWFQRAVVELPRDDFCRNKTDEMLRRSTAIDYRRDRQCAGQANQGPPPNCTSQLQAMHQLEDRARSGPNMGAVGQPAQIDRTIMNQANVLKVQLAAQSCRDPNAPLTQSECLAASITGVDTATLQKAGCSP